MFFTGFQIFFFFLIGSSYSENGSFHLLDAHSECPDGLDINPCTCYTHSGESSMYCDNIEDTTELQRVFNSINETHYFNVIDIHGASTFMDRLHAQVFSPQSFRVFHLSNNYIHYVEDEAFKGSEESAIRINLDGNQMMSFSFGALKGMKSLQILELQNNHLQAIILDAYVFENLWFLNISFNRLKETIQPNTFSRLPGLRLLLLNNNQLRYLMARSLAFDNQTGGVTVDLQTNFIIDINDEAFAGSKIDFLNLANNHLYVLNENAFRPLLQDGSIINVEGNRFICDDDRMVWLKNFPTALKQRIKGFQCSDGKGLDDL